VTGINIGGSAITPVGGTPFAILDEDFSDPGDEADRTDVWAVPGTLPEGNANQARLTFNPLNPISSGDQRYSTYPILSPNRTKILFKWEDATNDRSLAVMNANGSGITIIKANGVAESLPPPNDPAWCGNSLVLYGAFTSVGGFPVQTELCTVTPAGVDNGSIVSVTPGGIPGFCGSPDGSRIAYYAAVGSDIELHACDPDGSNDELLTSYTFGGSTGDPVWYLDGSAIFFFDGTGWSKINPDGTGETSVIAAAPLGFWYREGMSPLGLFYTDTTDGSNWRIGLMGFDGSVGIFYNFRLSQAVQRGAAIYDSAPDRVFSVMHESVAPDGADTVFSVDMAAANPLYHYVADESGAPLFQDLSFR
jgi:hypothetical protein